MVPEQTDNKPLCVSGSRSSMPRHQRSHTTGHLSVRTPSGELDVSDRIMDSIDAALIKMKRLPDSSMKSQLNQQQRHDLSEQGVEFDTGDDTTGGKITLKESLAQLRANKSFEQTGEDGDTGVGSVEDGGSDTERGNTGPIIGQAQVYGSASESDTELEEDMKGGYAEIDSDSAKQLNEKYKMIMKTKKAGDALRQMMLSEQGSVRTEDFESKFRDLGIPVPTSKTPAASCRRKSGIVDSLTDLESIQTDDIEKEYQKSLVPSDNLVSDCSQTRPLTSKPPQSKKSKSSTPNPPPSTPHKKKRSRSVRYTGHGSDRDSIQTEDFENQFQTMMIKQVANVPITHFDQFIVDSDLDTVRSQVIREKFLTALNKSFGGDSDESDSESRIDEMVEQKIHEILQRVKSAEYLRHKEESEEEVHVYPRSRSSKVKRSSRKSPTVQRKGQRYDVDTIGQNGQEIERQSAEIRRQVEGWHSPDRSMSPQHRSRTPTYPSNRPLKTSSQRTRGLACGPFLSQSFHSLPMHFESETPPDLKLRDDLSKMHLDIVRAKQEKQSLKVELGQMQGQVQQYKQEIKDSEKQVKDCRSKVEDTRSELMLAEFKRDSSRKEMEKLQDDLKVKRSDLEAFADNEETTTDGNTSTDYSKIRDLKLSRTEVAKLMSERDELQVKATSTSTMQREKQELEHQLQTAKNNLISEQKAARERLETVQEEIDNYDCRLGEVTTERNTIQKKANELEERVKQLEEERKEVVHEKDSDYRDLQSKGQEQIAQLKDDMSQELAEVRKQLAVLTERLSSAAAELSVKDEQSMTVREQLLTVQTRLSEEVEKRTHAEDEKRKQVETILQEKEHAVSHIRLQAEEAKTHSLEALSHNLEKQHQQLLTQVENKFTDDLSDLQGHLTTRDLELDVLREKLRQQEALGKQLVDKIRTEANAKFQQLVQEERSSWEVEKEQDVSRQLGVMRDEMERTAKQLREELAGERQLVDTQLKQIMDLKKDNHRTLERLRETICRQEAEVGKLRQDNKEMTTREYDIQSSVGAQDRQLVTDINEECRKIAAYIGSSPRVVSFSGYQHTGSPSKFGSKGQVKSAIVTAMGNLKSTNEDLMSFLKGVRQELENQKHAIRAVDKEKKESMDTLKQKMQKEKLQALETLKDRLIKEHLEEVDKLHKSLGKGKSIHKSLREKDKELQEIQINMKKWKNQTTEKLARQFQAEMAGEIEKRLKEYKKQQKDWERERASKQRDIERLEKEITSQQHKNIASNLTPHRAHTQSTPATPVKALHPSSSSSETEVTKVIKHLQGKVKQLQVENSSLRHGSKLSSSTPDITAALSCLSSIPESPKKSDHAVRQVELQLHRAENRAKMAEDRSEKNESLLNQKLLDMSKLQSTLTQQTKELMQLERAYSQLQQKTGCIRPSSRVGFQR